MRVPSNVKQEAIIGLAMHRAGFNGGTDTGFERGRQLASGWIAHEHLPVMKAWFARHHITSRPGYLKWIEDGRPTTLVRGTKNKYRGAVAYLLWGGSSAEAWVNSMEFK